MLSSQVNKNSRLQIRDEVKNQLVFHCMSISEKSIFRDMKFKNDA